MSVYLLDQLYPKGTKMVVKKGLIVDGREVVETGESQKLWSSHLTPVRFSDGKFGILTWSSLHETRLWNPDLEAAKLAIEESTVMPTVGHGIGTDVVHVCGQDTNGHFLVKMYYNAKKDIYGRVDEMHTWTD